jgi:DNA (cytosine-5)-methyltransferase 1
MRHGSLFSGIGGFDLASEWMGWENVFHCEWNEFVKKVLKYYWPNSISYHDITKTNFAIHRGQIDILTGGFPCQPYSQAGKRLGKADDRHLWPEMLRAIREIQPRYIVGENVSGLVNWNGGMVFEEVQADLEAEGYEVTSFLLPACGVNAPHRRDRVWFVAYSNNIRFKGGKQGMFQAHEKRHDKKDMHTRELFKSEWRNSIPRPKISIDDDGISSRLDGITFSKWRNESIKATGNAIVPQVALQIFKAIEQYDRPKTPNPPQNSGTAETIPECSRAWNEACKV